MKEVLLGLVICLFGLALAIICGVNICDTILDSNLYDSGFGNQTWVILRVMFWAASMVLDVFFVIVPALRMIQDR